jgi:allantoin racemase
VKILEIIPWKADEGLVEYERSFVPSDVDVVDLSEGILAECQSDLARSLPALLDAIVNAEKQGYDAVVIACFGDPGVEIARELVSIPVLGPLNVSLHVSQMIGHRTLHLVPEYARGRYFSKANHALYGLQDRVVLRGTNSGVGDAFKAYQDYKATGKLTPFMTELLDICEKSIKEDDVDVVVFGCGAVKWMKDILENELAKRGYSITIINPLTTAIEVARALVNLKLTHSRVGYPTPRPAEERYCGVG